MKIENTEVYGFNASIRGMRNPKNSWDKSDSFFIYYDYQWECYCGTDSKPFDSEKYFMDDNIEDFVLGKADKKLANNLVKFGSEHCKFLREIQVWFDLTLPRYIWSEFDTYKFHTSNSCSTMHTIYKRLLTQDDFEQPINSTHLDFLNELITKRKENELTASDFIHKIKNNLPEGFLQKRTINTNYAELLNIYKQRYEHPHRLYVWKYIGQFILTLPYFCELTDIENKID